MTDEVNSGDVNGGDSAPATPENHHNARTQPHAPQQHEMPLAMVLGQGAINLGVADRFLGDDPAALVAQIEALSAQRLGEIVRENLSADRMIVTHLVATGEAE